MKGHRDLIAWQKAMELVTEVYRITVYRITKTFLKEELYGLTGQIRRSAVSVPSNLAEGHGRNSRKEFHQFVGQARGSLVELETQLEIAANLGYVRKDVADALLTRASEVGRLVNGLRDWTASRADS